MSADRNSELEEAIEGAYAALHVPKPRSIEGCPCCTDKQALCKLLAKSLRDLTADELGGYGASVFLTLGAEEDFRYFLPRLLEIATHEEWWPSPEVLLEKLKLARWTSWSKRERTAVENVIDAWYAASLAKDPPEGNEIDALLCGIVRAQLSLARRLDALTEHPAALQAFFEQHAHAVLKKRRLANEFWRDHPEGTRLVIDYLNSPNIRARLQQ